MNLQNIILEIEAYILKHGGRYPEWYAGVASDPKVRLFNDHNVSEIGGAWIYSDCSSDMGARNVEEYLLKKGCDGGTGGGDNASRYVYAYKKAWHTKP